MAIRYATTSDWTIDGQGTTSDSDDFATRTAAETWIDAKVAAAKLLGLPNNMENFKVEFTRYDVP